MAPLPSKSRGGLVVRHAIASRSWRGAACDFSFFWPASRCPRPAWPRRASPPIRPTASSPRKCAPYPSTSAAASASIRCRRRSPKGARAYVHQWPGVYFEAAFRGDSVTLKFDDTFNEYRLLIDDLAPIALAQPGRSEIRIDALKPGPHRLRLEKLTESVTQVAAFQGFYVPASATPGRVPPRARQIEYIGDSSMTGYGNRSTVRQCTPEEARLTTDSQQTYPALVAKHFDADYQINAASARGVVRNYGGFGPEIVMPLIHPYVFLDKTVLYDDPAWRPQIIVIRLIADILLPLNPTEKWQSFAALEEDYARSYGAFVAALHRRAPGAAFLIWWPDANGIGDPEARRKLWAWQQIITDAAKAAGVKSIEFLPMPNLGYERSACDGHDSLADHRKTAAWLDAIIEARPDLWRRR